MDYKRKQQVYQHFKIRTDYRSKRLILRYKSCHVYSVSITRWMDENVKTFIGVNLCMVDIRSDSLRSQYQLCDFKWNNKMYQWSYPQWALFIVLLLQKLELNNVTSILVTYKIRKIAEFQYHEILQKHVKELLSTPKFAFLGGFCPYFNPDEALRNDTAFLFDTNDSIYEYLKVSLGVCLEDRTECPAATYYPHVGVKILDCNNKTYDSQKEYIQSRLNAAYKKTLHSHKYIKHMFDFITEMCQISAPEGEMAVDYDVMSYVTKMEEFKKYIYPKRHRKLSNKYGFQCQEKYRKKCEVCLKIERVGDEKKNDHKYVDKIYVCECKRLYVCSVKCQKYAWKKNHHRLLCKAKLTNK
eukprot:585399_1